jgi:hypothetical protein
MKLAALVIIVAASVSACSSETAATTTSKPPPEPPANAPHATHVEKRHRHRKRAHAHRGTHAKKRHRTGVPAADLPNRALTPGVALGVGRPQICVPGYASAVRNVPQSETDAVYARYGVAHVPYAHEVDHLISLELGGSNSIRNLWPEPYAGRWGARTKDVLENTLHELVCSGRLALRYAQHIEATNWVAAYRRYVGGAPSATTTSTSGGGGSGSSTSVGGYYASSYPSARTIYCADDSEWRSLSKTYLVHFATWAAAHRRFPAYHLHQPC